MRKGLFITLEGGDGAGKSTQIDNIEKYFVDCGYKCIRSREPGGTLIGERLREILLDPTNSDMSPVTEMMIYAATRAQHVSDVIKPSIEKGMIVICDRYLDSSVAYQSYGRGLNDIVLEVNKYAIDGIIPDITFWMDINPESGKKRVKNRNNQELDRLESEDIDFHNKVYDGYRQICEKNPDRIKRIDATKTIEEIKNEIYGYLDELCARLHY